MSLVQNEATAMQQDLFLATSDPRALAHLRSNLRDTLARLCFRALALGLAAVVLMLMSVSLHAVTAAFVAHARTSSPPGPAMNAPIAAPRASEAATVRDLAEAMATPWPQAVAVITVLLIGVVVLAIGLIRATFTLTVHTEPVVVEQRSALAAPDGLPGVELLKATTDAIATVLKGLPRR